MATKTTVISFRAEEPQVNALDALCNATERDRAYHLTRALNRYLASEQWHIDAIQEGIESADAGQLLPLDDVKAKYGVKKPEKS